MASPQVSPLQASTDSSRSILTWIVTIAACAYIAWIGISLYRSTSVFAAMFNSMGVELPAATRFVVHNYEWYYPSLFGGAIALLIAKQFFIPDKWKSFVFTFACLVLADFGVNGAIRALYRPLFDVLQKINR